MRFIVSSLLFALASCSSDGSPVVARVGDSQITAADLEHFVSQLSSTLRSQKEGREADLDHLNSIIDKKILVLEARSRGLHEAETFRYDFREAVEGRLAELFEFRVIAPQIELTDEDIKRTFKESGLDRERRVRRIMVGSEAAAEQVVKELKAGTLFEEMAQRFAANDEMTRNGELGFIGLMDTPQRAIPRRSFTSLPTGEYAINQFSPALWQVIQFVEDRQADMFRHGERIERALYQEQVWLEKQEEVEILTHQYGVRLVPEGLRVLLGHPNLQKLELTPAQAELPFYRFDDGHISVGECLKGLQSIGHHIPLEDSARVVNLADKVVLQAWLFAAAARDKGLDKEEEFTDWRQRKYDELLVTRLMESEVDDRIDISEAQVRADYKADRERFRASEEVILREVYATSEDQASELRRLLETGATVPELLAHNDVYSHGKKNTGGELRVNEIRAGAMPELVEPALAAREGEVVGPVWVEHHRAFSVFRVVKRVPSRIRPFEEVETHARYLITHRREQELTIAFIRSLRESYEDRIEIFEERLG